MIPQLDCSKENWSIVWISEQQLRKTSKRASNVMIQQNEKGYIHSNSIMYDSFEINEYVNPRRSRAKPIRTFLTSSVANIDVSDAVRSRPKLSNDAETNCSCSSTKLRKNSPFFQYLKYLLVKGNKKL